jgi:CRP/FNR family cyclic AMP-dependent transcriptional regulator
LNFEIWILDLFRISIFGLRIFCLEEKMVSAEWLKKTELFGTLSEAQLNILLSHSSVESLPEGRTIFSQGDEANRLCILIEGAVDLSVKTGEKIDFMTSKIEKEGTVFGIPSLIEPFRYNVTATCLKPSKVLMIDAGNIKTNMEKDPKMGMEMMKKLASIYLNRLNEMRSGVSNLLKVFKCRIS